jgi:hypothetical protein
MSVLKELSVKHPYYCSDGNFYSNDPNTNYHSMSDFLRDYKDCDIDLNLIFRWDIVEHEEGNGRYEAYVFMIQQRKGIFKPFVINDINEAEAVKFKEVALQHWDKLKQLWDPLSK